MGVRLNDQDTERLCLELGLLDKAGLESYHARVAEDPSYTLFDLLVAEGVIPYDLLVELEKELTGNAPPPQQAAPAPQAAQTPMPPQAPQAAPEPQTAAEPADDLGDFARPKARKMRRAFDDFGGGEASEPQAPAAPQPQVAAAPQPAAQPPAQVSPAPKQEAPPAQSHDDEEEEGHLSFAGYDEVPEGWPGGLAPADPTPGGIQEMLTHARSLGASDFHLSPGLPPYVRLHGKLQPMVEGYPGLTKEQTQGLIKMTLTPQQWDYFSRTGDLDFCYAFEGGGRFRTNIMRERNGDGMICRLIGERIFGLEELGIPEQAKRLTEFAQGLVLVTGPSGHGKTTTMMSLVDMVNGNRPDHIITVEEPIEYILQARSCQVTQREVGPHTQSFETALRAALREDPDIIVIGELRDYKTTSMAINAAETGHLVFTSLPTQDAAKTIDKVLDYFPPEEQTQIRLMLSESLRGVISQQLCARADGTGRIAAVELLFNSVAVGNIIREANTAGLVNAMQLGKNKGMVLMDESLEKLLNAEIISGQEAWSRASNKQKFAKFAPKKEVAAAAAQ